MADKPLGGDRRLSLVEDWKDDKSFHDYVFDEASDSTVAMKIGRTQTSFDIFLCERKNSHELSAMDYEVLCTQTMSECTEQYDFL